ncbi:MAG: nickel-dependent lactate racemase [Methanobacteriota archaeon]|nr:MAG: nickel-dependent lactate racemase [Euryarchaeota archaeon]
MKVEIPFGDGIETVDVSDEAIGGVISPNELGDCDEGAALRAALSNPIGSDGLAEFLQGASSALIIVNDATRPTPTAKILDQICPELENLDVKFIVATGIHRAPTEEEYRLIFGERYDEIESRVFSHDSKESEMVLLDTTKRGTEIRVNKMVTEANRIVVIGSVEPHYFAGYTGGRKAFLPGVCAYETIEQNHKHALAVEAQVLTLDGNPVHDDMEDAMACLEKYSIFSIMVVLDRNRKICSAYAGDIDSTFNAAVQKADEIFVVNMSTKADVVVAVTLYPQDVDLYQSQKALDNAKYAVKDGGVIILVSACRTGVGPPAFLKLLGSAETPEEVRVKIAEGYKLGYHKAAKIAEIELKMKMYAVTNLEPSIATRAHLIPMRSVQEAVDTALAEMGEGAKVTFIMDAVFTVPRVQSAYEQTKPIH